MVKDVVVESLSAQGKAKLAKEKKRARKQDAAQAAAKAAKPRKNVSFK